VPPVTIEKRAASRAADSDNILESKASLQITLYHKDRLPPRETHTMTIEVGNVEKTVTAVAELARKSGGRLGHSSHNRDVKGQVVSVMVFDVPLASGSGSR
jgi:hypothetical protein